MVYGRSIQSEIARLGNSCRNLGERPQQGAARGPRPAAAGFHQPQTRKSHQRTPYTQTITHRCTDPIWYACCAHSPNAHRRDEPHLDDRRPFETRHPSERQRVPRCSTPGALLDRGKRCTQALQQRLGNRRCTALRVRPQRWRRTQIPNTHARAVCIDRHHRLIG
jgi:hypothetical protein